MTNRKVTPMNPLYRWLPMALMQSLVLFSNHATAAAPSLVTFRSNHVAWQWQCSVDVAPVSEDSLDDLRYSTVPKVPGP
jgi:hypothetical protein